MAYDILATSKTPALIIYVLDVSASMTQMMGAKRRLDVVSGALLASIRQMVYRATKGTRVQPRYRIAMLAYSDHVYDLLDGVKTIDYLASKGIPDLVTMRNTDTAKAFSEVEKVLQREMENLAGCPAPLVCHITDGEYTGSDPEAIVRRIMAMQTSDGNVLVENIFISNNLLAEEISNARQWSGVNAGTRLNNDYARKLRSMSSPLPDNYRVMMLESGYHIDAGAVMMLPGISPELVEMGFVMSASTR